MGTRADFYVGRGSDAEWLGSIAWDGYPDGTPRDLVASETEETFRAEAARMLSAQDATTPAMGWPWPWTNSSGTDYSYAWDDGAVWAACFGGPWVRADAIPADGVWPEAPEATFPDMRGRQKIARGPRSGLLVVGIDSSGRMTVE